MPQFTQDKDFYHGKPAITGVLLVNLGTPNAPDAPSVRRYLKQFLSDPRVVEIPRLIWWLILHCFVLTKRPKQSAQNYAKVWTDRGSPLLLNSQALTDDIDHILQRRHPDQLHVKLAMTYGEPSIPSALNKLRQAGMHRLLVLPLYPQYSGTTTAAVYDAVFRELKHWRWVPELRLINGYHNMPQYIEALAASIRQHWQTHETGEQLLFSFHGIPKRNLHLGDPYHCFCHETARLVAEALNLSQEQYQVTFQSRFGKAEWLKPYTDVTLKTLAQEGLKSVDVIAAGFSADCLETLEELGVENRDIFLDAGGDHYHYIPALNNDVAHVDALVALIETHLAGWGALPPPDSASIKRAKDMGAKL